MANPTSRKAAYPYRFLGRRLDAAVRRLVAERTYTSEADVARWLETEASTFNRWVNGYSHPKSDEDWEKLTKLGFNLGFLRRLQWLDKLDAWRRDQQMSLEDVAGLGVQILSEKTGAQIFRD